MRVPDAHVSPQNHHSHFCGVPVFACFKRAVQASQSHKLGLSGFEAEFVLPSDCATIHTPAGQSGQIFMFAVCVVGAACSVCSQRFG